MLTRSTLSDVLKNAQRTLAECTQLLCAGRAGFPEFLQIFRATFAKKMHHLDAGLARDLALERTPTRRIAGLKLYGARNHAGRVHATFARAAR